MAVAAAAGRVEPGAMETWLAELEMKLSSAKSLISEVPDASNDYRSLSHAELEYKVIAVDALNKKVARLRYHFKFSIAQDDHEREQSRMDRRVHDQAMFERKL